MKRVGGKRQQGEGRGPAGMPRPAHLQLSAGHQEYAGADVFPAALSPRGVLRRAPLPQFKGRGQGPGQAHRGAHTVGQPVRLVGVERALHPRVLVQLRRGTGHGAGLRQPSLPQTCSAFPRAPALQHSSSRGRVPLPLHPNPLGPAGPRTSSDFPWGSGAPPPPNPTHILVLTGDFTRILALLSGEVDHLAGEICQGILHHVGGVGGAGDSGVVLERPVP